MVTLRVENLTKRFGTLEAVSNLHLDVKDKEFVCMLGPSGCGKTTTLRCIAGLERQDEGNIYIDDALINDIPPAKRDIAMVFQFFALYPGMTAFDDIAFPLKAQKLPKEEIKRRVKETAERLHIDYLLKEKTSRLTVGEKQRVALARALVRRPRLFLLDEPLTNLDAKLRAEMRAELKRLLMEDTALYVTHDQLEAIAMADRIAVMDHGKLLQYGTPDEVYGRPKNLFVAGFIGSPSMNFIDCTFEEKKGKAFLNAGTFSIDVSDFRDMVAKQASNSELILGIRPEDIKVAKERTPESIETEVYTVEPMGYRMILNLKVGANVIQVISRVTFRTERGETLYVTFEKDKMYLFDKKTRQSII